MDTDAVVLAEVTRRGRRLLTRREILALGISPEEVECRVRRGSWQRIHAGVYLIGAGALTFEERACAAALAGAPHARAGGVVGARLHGIGDFGSFLEVWAPHGTDVVARGVRVHRTRKAGVPVLLLGPCRVPTACVEQVLLDLAARLPRRALHQVFTTAWRKRKTTPAAVLLHVDRFGGRGVRGSGVLRELAELYAGVERGPGSEAEADFLLELFEALEAAGIEAPTPQLAIKVDGGRQTVVPDFGWSRRWAVIEMLGLEAHGDYERQDDDVERASLIRNAGWALDEVTPRAIRTRPAEKVRRLVSFLRAHPPIHGGPPGACSCDACPPSSASRSGRV